MILRQKAWGDENVKGRRKVGESVNVKKMSTIWWGQFFYYLNLSKIFYIFYFLKQNGREYK